MSDKSCLETVVDYIPQYMKDMINEHIGENEDIKAIVKGRSGEAVIVTNQKVCTINNGEIFQPFEKDEIKGVKLSRKNRVGRFELLVENPEKYIVKLEEGQCKYGPDLSKNIVNFPYSKFPMFNVVEKHINVMIGKAKIKYDFE
ncbi:hypothetical protein [Candidatus Contubernalis alkaliaceticus]|uniref:hypothetical protein n=1 Tax=Candidatus Contubernalis alkaliaceticus TaxID=338645 RepID=UPI001F4C1DCF|nr:hypothetical protein [Candidatus Contubernalis alkalaceticus]UNC90993.1 hypothetical protein HUE98_02190 [Candidatus Contubernalis alkalaceticus]